MTYGDESEKLNEIVRSILVKIFKFQNARKRNRDIIILVEDFSHNC